MSAEALFSSSSSSCCCINGVARALRNDGEQSRLADFHFFFPLRTNAKKPPLLYQSCPLRAGFHFQNCSTKLCVGTRAPSNLGALKMDTIGDALEAARKMDDELSKRHILLDPIGYFVIYVDHESREIVANHYKNVINSRGLACDPETGEVIPCDGSYKPKPFKTFRGRSAKELCILVFESEDAKNVPLVSYFDHAAYLGREFQRAEFALYSQTEYVQD